MRPEPTSSTAPSIDATKRKLMVGIVMVTLIALVTVIAALARLGLVWDVVTPETMAHRRELRRVERTGVERGAGLEPEPGR